MSWLRDSESKRKSEVEVESEPENAVQDVGSNATPVIDVVPSDVVPVQSQEVESQRVVEGGVSAEDLLGHMGEGESGVAVAREFASTLPMKSNIKNSIAFTSVQVIADYSESLGLVKRAKFRRKICEWQYQHAPAVNGKRAEEVLDTVKSEIMRQYEIEKRSGLEKAVS